MNKVVLEYKADAQYPDKKYAFRPDEAYPEYPFAETSPEKNNVYEMIREAFRRMGLDRDRQNSPSWNPLGEMISPGMTVLVKPNMVEDKNPSGGGTDCLYTHPSLVAAVVDYIWIALKGSGRIIIADAPLQSCDFEKLVRQSGYDTLLQYYEEKGINIDLLDFRGLVSKQHGEIMHQRLKPAADGICVNLGMESAHANLTLKQLQDIRITNYNPAEIKIHHSEGRHEYLIAKEVLQADVIINLSKPKTHRKAGVTIALKNFVGANVRKEYLPHHRLGDKKHGGDEYLNPSRILWLASRILDDRNAVQARSWFVLAHVLSKLAMLLNILARLTGGIKEFREGSWYGNDTIWRTICDLNRIIAYSDKFGNMQTTPQRFIFNIADMIVTGEKEGPVEPSPKQAGLIAIGKNSVCFDEVIATIMGMDACMIPSITNARRFQMYPLADADAKPVILSNNSQWDRKDISAMQYADTLQLEPSKGWKGHIELNRSALTPATTKSAGSNQKLFQGL